MTDKELRKLKRADLLEILFHLQKELDEVRSENLNLKQQLQNGSGMMLSDESMQQLIDGVAAAIRQPGNPSGGQNGKQPAGGKRRR
ncbi:MAG: hypothetical protein IKL87_05555 [Oscillospiraceae bacterium]|nr:hypothetical protein [Oscillospiraceae bacterium]